MIKKVVILGGGVGGLTVAHELARCGGYDIHIYEKNETLGGMARSGFKEWKGIKLPTEYCWRIYGPNYNNLRQILKQIPLKENSAKSVHHQLVDIRDYLIADQGKIFFMNNKPTTLLSIRRAFKKVPFYEKWSVLSKIFYCFMISDERLHALDALSWNEYINPKNSLSPDMRKYIVDTMAPFLGAEATSVNVPSVVKTLESFKFFNRPISVMNGPTNQSWFDHWKVDLESKGVCFHLDSKVKDINANHDKIESIELLDGTKITGDHFFSCLPIEGLANMPSLQIDGIKELAKRSYQLMVGIQLYFNKKITLPTKNTAMYIPDSRWLLVIEPQGSIWDKKYGDIADFWSIGLCNPIRPGLIMKKPFIECSHEEIKKEVWHQILASEFSSYLNLKDVQIVDYNVWDTYVFNGKKIETEEPKFSTNKGTYFLRPDNKTNYKNLYIATAYTKTEIDMFEMESAAESGRRAARILEKTVKVLNNSRPLFFAPYRLLDGTFPQLNLFQRFPFLFLFLGLPFAFFTLSMVHLRDLFSHITKK